ncbi:MAG: sigma-70 family RNA polymerase sigma factor [Verrucomicrobiales bacterium]
MNTQVTSDADLLWRFVQKRDEEAFRDLVTRHGGTVFGIAWRRTRDAALSEDISQIVFALLARKARSLTRHSALSAWLHRTTLLETAKAIRTETRRKQKLNRFADETQNAMTSQQALTESECQWESLMPHLDEAIAALSERDRTVLCLRYFEKRTLRDISPRIGKSEAATQKIAKRGLDKLHRLLIKKANVTTGVTTLASLLSARLGEAAPVAVTGRMADAALAASIKLTSTQILANTLLTMSTSYLKTAAIALIIVAFPVVSEIRAIQQLETQSEALRAELALVGGVATRPTGLVNTRRPNTLTAAALTRAQIDTLLTQVTEALGAMKLNDAMVAIGDFASALEVNQLGEVMRMIAASSAGINESARKMTLDGIVSLLAMKDGEGTLEVLRKPERWIY